MFITVLYTIALITGFSAILFLLLAYHKFNLKYLQYTANFFLALFLIMYNQAIKISQVYDNLLNIFDNKSFIIYIHYFILTLTCYLFVTSGILIIPSLTGKKITRTIHIITRIIAILFCISWIIGINPSYWKGFNIIGSQISIWGTITWMIIYGSLSLKLWIESPLRMPILIFYIMAIIQNVVIIILLILQVDYQWFLPIHYILMCIIIIKSIFNLFIHTYTQIIKPEISTNSEKIIEHKNPPFQNIDSLINIYSLTPRELDITKLVVQGLNNTQIAKTLFISIKTVENHLSSIYKKTDVQNRYGLISKIMQENQKI